MPEEVDETNGSVCRMLHGHARPSQGPATQSGVFGSVKKKREILGEDSDTISSEAHHAAAMLLVRFEILQVDELTQL